MSSRRATTSSGITQDEINVLVSKLQTLLPHLNQRQAEKVPTSKILKETCNYIRMLHTEVDELSETLSQLLLSMDNNGIDVEAALKSLLQP